MSDPKYNFQYCQKLVVFSEDRKKLLMAKRKGEADYDGTFTFIGGKMENTDQTILAGLKREKDEEVGSGVKLKVFPLSTYNTLYSKKDGNKMVLPYYLSYYVDGVISLNVDEYSEYKWVATDKFAAFEPKIQSDVKAVSWAIDLAKIASESDFVEI